MASSFVHTKFIKKAYLSRPTSNNNSSSIPKPVKYRPVSLINNSQNPTNDDDDEENSSHISKVMWSFSFFLLLIMCISTIVDVRTDRFDQRVHDIAASLRDDTRQKLSNSIHTSSTSNDYEKVEHFNLQNFYTLDNQGNPKELKSISYPKGGPVIAILTTNTTMDIDNAITAIKSLAFLQGDPDYEKKAPILFFHEGNLNRKQKVSLLKYSPDRPVAFPTVDFEEYPKGFDKSQAKAFRVKGRDHPLGYHQMIRFWVTTIWNHPALEPFDIVMRMDTDSCFKDVNEILPGFKNDDIVYHSQFVGVESRSDMTTDLIDHAEKFLDRYNKSPGNPMLWRYAKMTWETSKTIPLFMTNLEVSRKSWMQKNIVKRWHEALTEEKPYGVFTYRWGDAVTRFLMVAMLSMNFQLDTSYPDGYFHKENCKREDVEKALEQYRSFMNDAH